MTGARPEGLAISGSATNGVRILNGTISNFGTAVSLASTEHVVIRDMTFDGNDNGVHVGLGAAVKDSYFHQTASFDAAVIAGEGSVLDHCIFRFNDISARMGPGSLVTYNVSKRGNEDGIIVGEKSVVIGNSVFDTYDEGLRVGARSTVVNNNVFGSGAGDLYITCPSNVMGNSAGSLALSNRDQEASCKFSDNLFLGEY